MRIVDKNALHHVRYQRDGCCLAGLIKKDGCSGGLDVHHISHKGSGGDDTPENLITLCRKHHNAAHAEQITRKELRDILKKFFGYKYENC